MMISLTEREMAIVEEIAERYCTSTPVSGSWETEEEHEKEAVAKALNIDIKTAGLIMEIYL